MKDTQLHNKIYQKFSAIYDSLHLTKVVLVTCMLTFLAAIGLHDLSMLAHALGVCAPIMATYYLYILARANAPMIEIACGIVTFIATFSYIIGEEYVGEWALSALTDIGIISLITLHIYIRTKNDHRETT